MATTPPPNSTAGVPSLFGGAVSPTTSSQATPTATTKTPITHVSTALPSSSGVTGTLLGVEEEAPASTSKAATNTATGSLAGTNLGQYTFTQPNETISLATGQPVSKPASTSSAPSGGGGGASTAAPSSASAAPASTASSLSLTPTAAPATPTLKLPSGQTLTGQDAMDYAQTYGVSSDTLKDNPNFESQASAYASYQQLHGNIYSYNTGAVPAGATSVTPSFEFTPQGASMTAIPNYPGYKLVNVPAGSYNAATGAWAASPTSYYASTAPAATPPPTMVQDTSLAVRPLYAGDTTDAFLGSLYGGGGNTVTVPIAYALNPTGTSYTATGFGNSNSKTYTSNGYTFALDPTTGMISIMPEGSTAPIAVTSPASAIAAANQAANAAQAYYAAQTNGAGAPTLLQSPSGTTNPLILSQFSSNSTQSNQPVSTATEQVQSTTTSTLASQARNQLMQSMYPYLYNLIYNNLSPTEASIAAGLQNIERNVGQVLINIPNSLFGTQLTNPVPLPPASATAAEQQYLTQTLPGYIKTGLTFGGSDWTGQAARALSPYATTAISNIPQSLAAVSAPNQSPTETAYNLAFLISSGVLPVESVTWGMASGAINTLANAVLGGTQTSPQAFGTGYKFGAATAPLFMGAGQIGNALAGSTPATQIANPYLRFLARSFPTSTLFGGLQAGQGYLQGQQTPADILANFGIGYGTGTLFQGAGELFGKINPIKFGNIDFTNPLYEGKSLYFRNPLTGDITPLISFTSTPTSSAFSLGRLNNPELLAGFGGTDLNAMLRSTGLSFSQIFKGPLEVSIYADSLKAANDAGTLNPLVLQDFTDAKEIAYGINGLKAPTLDEYVANLKGKVAESQVITDWIAKYSDYFEELHGSAVQNAFFPELREGADQDLTWKANAGDIPAKATAELAGSLNKLGTGDFNIADKGIGITGPGGHVINGFIAGQPQVDEFGNLLVSPERNTQFGIEEGANAFTKAGKTTVLEPYAQTIRKLGASSAPTYFTDAADFQDWLDNRLHAEVHNSDIEAYIKDNLAPKIQAWFNENPNMPYYFQETGLERVIKEPFDAITNSKLVDYHYNNEELAPKIDDLAKTYLAEGKISPDQYQAYVALDPSAVPKDAITPEMLKDLPASLMGSAIAPEPASQGAFTSPILNYATQFNNAGSPAYAGSSISQGTPTSPYGSMAARYPYSTATGYPSMPSLESASYPALSMPSSGYSATPYSITSAAYSAPSSTSSAYSPLSPSYSSTSSISSPSYSPSYYSPYPLYITAPATKEKPILLTGSRTIPLKLPASAATPTSQMATQYMPSVAVSLFPGLEAASVQPGSQLLGISPRSAYIGGATPASAATPTATAPTATSTAPQSYLDAPTSGELTTAEQQMALNYLNAISAASGIPQATSTAATPSAGGMAMGVAAGPVVGVGATPTAKPLANSQAVYQNSPAYQQMLAQFYQQQILNNLQSDVLRNFQTGLYQNELQQNLQGSMPSEALRQLLVAQGNLGNKQYPALGTAPIVYDYAKGFSGNPQFLASLNPAGLTDAQRRKLGLPGTPTSIAAPAMKATEQEAFAVA